VTLGRKAFISPAKIVYSKMYTSHKLMTQSFCYLCTGDATAQLRYVNKIYCRTLLLNIVPQMGPTQVSKAVAIFFIRRMQEIALSIFKENYKRHWLCSSVQNLWERCAQVQQSHPTGTTIIWTTVTVQFQWITYLMWQNGSERDDTCMVNLLNLISLYDILSYRRNWYMFPLSFNPLKPSGYYM
jgi:hypothetical protein